MKFNYAREVVQFLIREYGIKELHVPYYLCDVVRHAIFAAGAKPVFYHIDDNFFPKKVFSQDSFILYPNYFGICDNNVDKLAFQYKNLIVDNAHAYYANPKGFASIYSMRKFLPVESGAELFLGEGKKNAPLDYKRREKFDYYHSKLKNNELVININKECIPFCYPYLAPTEAMADELVKELTRSGLTIHRYWNLLPRRFNEYKFYSRLVPIPLE